MNNSELEISDFRTISSERYVRMPPEPGVIPDTNFDTLWSMVITLESTVQKKKEIWFVQDTDENRTSTVLEDRRNSRNLRELSSQEEEDEAAATGDNVENLI